MKDIYLFTCFCLFLQLICSGLCNPGFLFCFAVFKSDFQIGSGPDSQVFLELWLGRLVHWIFVSHFVGLYTNTKMQIQIHKYKDTDLFTEFLKLPASSSFCWTVGEIATPFWRCFTPVWKKILFLEFGLYEISCKRHILRCFTPGWIVVPFEMQACVFF